jgi:trk system potassium uptake protein TrkH
MQAGNPRRGGRVGNVRIRRARRRSRVVEVRALKTARSMPAGPFTLILGFALLVAMGTLLLMLPVATTARQGAQFTTALFTATSAVCVTGLVVVDTRDYWSAFGETVILVLIQLGGLGFMTSATLLLVLMGRRISLRQRMVTAETLGRLGVEHVGTLIRKIVVVTLAIEATGAAILTGLFCLTDRTLGVHEIWRGVFTAVSAFNNAGFDLEGGFRSLSDLRGNAPVLLVTAALVILGGTGFAIWSDLALRRRWSAFSLDTKLVLLTSVVLWGAGTVVIFLVEIRPGAALDGLSPVTALIDSFAMSVYARTAGFSVLNIAGLGNASLFFIAGLMFIGGAAASTAGGIKLTTFSTLFAAIVASLRGADHVTAFGREISWRQVNRALSIALLSLAVVFFIAFAASTTITRPFVDLLFESVSAFGTVGLSTGLTPDLTHAGRIVIAVAMFIGRLGPLTIALALAGRYRPVRFRYPEEAISIG